MWQCLRRTITSGARRRWAAYTGPRTFRAERTAFVQNTLGNCWIDLAEFPFGAPPASPSSF